MTDEELVLRWQQGRDRAALDELRRRTRPLVQSQVNKYRANSVPQSVLEAKADQILVESAGSYRPGTGAKFRTHLFTNLRRLNRFSAARSNIATIPEARTQRIGAYQRTYADLQARKRRPPTTSELADELNWQPSEVLTMQRSQRRDIMSSGLKVPARMDTTEFRRRQVMEDIWFELTPDEQVVYAHLTGTHGRRRIERGQDISMATNFSPAKVSQIRTSIGHKIERHL
jgi:DNA-directed RNA polymerase sigma subunit (sigma70/sigma32)